MTQLAYDDFRTEIADFLGWGRDSANWSNDESARLDAILRSGLAQVYHPASVSREGVVHQWSWMRPIATLTTSAPYATGTIEIVAGVVTLSGGTWPAWAVQGDLAVRGQTYTVSVRNGDTELTLHDLTAAVDAGSSYSLARYRYELPADFAGFEGGLTYRIGNEMHPPVEFVSDSMLRRLRQQRALSARPSRIATRPVVFDSTVGQRWEATLYPTPDAEYDLLYRYKVQPAMLDVTNKYPLGGPEVGELVLQSCLAVAEQRYRDERGAHTELFLERLRAAVANDAQSHSPDTLGYNADREGVGADRFGGDVIHTFEGVAYYDRNL